MPDSTAAMSPEGTGLASFVQLLRFHGVAADAAQIRHALGGAAFDLGAMRRLAGTFGLKARIIETGWTRP